MNTTASLSTADASSIIRLLGEVAIVEGSLAAQKRYLMDGLATIIDADSWAWATSCRFQSDEVPLNSGFLSGGFSPQQFAKFQEALEHPDTAVLNAGLTREFELRQTHLTRHRDQIDTEGLFYKSAVYPIWIAAGVEQVIMSVRPSGDRYISNAGLYRRQGRPPFSPREVKIAHIVLSEVPWLHDVLPSGLGTVVTQLTPRLRITLNLLVEGQSRTQIAEHLGLSVATVDGYVKDVFRHFRVHSQPSLMARFSVGDGGDTTPVTSPQ
jgi:DNA-binding CsgD family transcriptional regulator